MLTRTITAVLFLLQSFSTIAQENYDTIQKFNSFSSYFDKEKTFRPIDKQIRKYNAKGQLISIEAWRHNMTMDLIRDYMKIYTYGTNDSIKTETHKWIPYGYNDWKVYHIKEYIYQGNLLREVKITRPATSEAIRQSNIRIAKERQAQFPGVTVTDTSGWTENNVIKYEYDALNRLIKEEFYLDKNYSQPYWVWTYSYDVKDLPEINTDIGYFGNLKGAEHSLYKGKLLQKYREDKYKEKTIEIKTDEFSYTNEGKLEKIFTSNEEMELVKAGKKVFYKTSKKERLFHKQFYEYEGGRVSSAREESLVPHTVNKATFWDKLGAIRTSTSTTSYGGVERTTTTTTVSPVETTEKTKWSWEKRTIVYTYDAAGKLIKEKSEGESTEYIYDSKGRIREKKTIFPYVPGKESNLRESKTLYGYRK